MNNRKIISLTLVITLLFMNCIPAFANEFINGESETINNIYSSIDEEEYEFESNDDMLEANKIEFDTMNNGNLYSNSDVDYYKVNVLEASKITIQFSHTKFNEPLNCWDIYLVDEKGKEYLKFSSAGTSDEIVMSQGLKEGEYYIKVVAGESYSDINYKLKVKTTLGLYEYENNDTIAEANDMELGVEYAANLSSENDVDYYRVVVDETGKLEIKFSHVTFGNNTYWMIYLIDDTGKEYFSFSSKSNEGEEIRWQGLEKGVYYIKVCSAPRYTDKEYYISAMTYSGDYECENNGSTYTANQVDENITYTANLWNELDIDYYKFNVEEDSKVTFKFLHSTFNNSSSSWNIELFDENNNEYLTFSSTGKDSELTEWLGLTAGTYYIKISTGIEYRKTDYKFILSMEKGNYEYEDNGSTFTANEIKSGEVYIGKMETDADVDYYKVVLNKDSKVTMNFLHSAFENSRSSWEIEIADKNGVEYFAMESSGRNTDIREWQCLKAGTYYIKVAVGEAYSNINYMLTVSIDSGNYEAEENDNSITANSVRTGVNYVARLDHTADVDYYKFELDKDRTVEFTFNHNEIESEDEFFIVEILNKDGDVTNSFISKGNDVELIKRFEIKKGTSYMRVLAASNYSSIAYEIGYREIVPVEGVSLNKSSLTINVGTTATLVQTISPSNATNKNISWESSNTKVATVDEKGNITAGIAGTTTITVTTKDGAFVSSCKVTVLNVFGNLTVATVDKNSTTITGVGIAGAKVTAYVDNKSIGNATVDSKGSYLIKISKQSAGKVITLKMTKTSYAEKSITTTVQNVFSSLKINTITKNDTKITGVGTAGAKVTAYVSGKSIGSATVDSKGNYSIKISKQAAGAKVTVEMTKLNYVTKSANSTVQNVFSSLKINEITKNTTKITGTGTKGAKVTAYVGSKSIGSATVDSKGNYSIKISKQSSGKTVTIKMTKSGYVTKSATSTVKNVFSKFTVGKITKSTTKVTGTGTKGATVKIYVNNKVIGSAKVGSNGKYSVKIAKQKAGVKVTVKMTKSGYSTVSKTVTVSK